MIATTPPCGATCKRGSHTKMAPQGVLHIIAFQSRSFTINEPYSAVKFVKLPKILGL